MFKVMFYSPRIAPNTGNAIRMVAATGCELHLVEPPSGLVQIKILERYGDVIQLGDIRRWEDRTRPATAQRQ